MISAFYARYIDSLFQNVSSFTAKLNGNEKRAHEILDQNIAFYRQLNQIQQKEFRDRLFHFIIRMNFYGAQGFQIGFEHKVLISAPAIQLSFGLRSFHFDNISEIVIHQDVYVSPNTGALHRGETSPATETIHFSWKHFVEGFENQTDGINLGLHEIAHAFFSQIFNNFEDDESIDIYLNRFIFNAEEEIVKLREGRNHLFRAYAGSNIFEFFAVAVENFYEIPEKFAAEMPEIYKFLCLTLNQDPVKKSWNSFNYSDYFKVNTAFEKFDFHPENAIFELNSKEGFKYSIVFALIPILTILGFIIWLNNADSVFFMVFLIAMVIIQILKFVFSKSFIITFTNDYFLYRTKKFNKSEMVLAIPYSNLISIDFDSSIIFQYFNAGKIETLFFESPGQNQKDDLRSFALSKKIMLKSCGKRIPRIRMFR